MIRLQKWAKKCVKMLEPKKWNKITLIVIWICITIMVVTWLLSPLWRWQYTFVGGRPTWCLDKLTGQVYYFNEYEWEPVRKPTRSQSSGSSQSSELEGWQILTGH